MTRVCLAKDVLFSEARTAFLVRNGKINFVNNTGNVGNIHNVSKLARYHAFKVTYAKVSAWNSAGDEECPPIALSPKAMG